MQLKVHQFLFPKYIVTNYSLPYFFMTQFFVTVFSYLSVYTKRLVYKKKNKLTKHLFCWKKVVIKTIKGHLRLGVFVLLNIKKGIEITRYLYSYWIYPFSFNYGKHFIRCAIKEYYFNCSIF